MKNYIVRNCPAHFNNVQMLEFSKGDCNSDKVLKAYCQDCTDCVIKQIVFFCKMDVGSKDNMFFIPRYALADLILDMLGIEEVDEK